MTLDELAATYAFTGRTDLLLRLQPELSVEEIVDGVRDEQWVTEHATGRPFYTGISYMLVSMECLIAAAYTRKAEAAGLTDNLQPSMGRVEARFADWRIGVASYWAQLWIDRNFALDYPDAAYAGLLRAHELGVTLFDTADVYGLGQSERLLGRLLRQVNRDELIVSSKVGYFAGTARHPYDPEQMRRQFATTLDNLGTTHLDVYFLHSSDFGPDDEYLPGAVDVL
ncbi:MAG: aldo/keto reductase [Pseudonocardiaceae bacterium]